MRAAPAVSAPLDDCLPEQLLIALLYGATGAALAAWAAAHGQRGSGPAWLLLGLAIGAALGLVVARRVLPGKFIVLTWDGAAWSVQRPVAQALAETVALTSLRLLMDLGPWLLLRAADGAGRPHWLVLRERRVGAGWHLLRVALTAHAQGRP